MRENDMSNTSTSGGQQNIAQGDHAIGQQNNYGIPPALFAEYAGKLAVTETALASFFTILEEQQVPRSDLDSKLREIAAQYKELLLRMETVQSEDPQVVRLKDEARQAIEAVDYAKAEVLLNQADARDIQAFEQLEAAAKRDMEAAKQRRISSAASCVDNARLQEVQLRYAKAAAYWQKAAALLPETEKQERSRYLHSAAFDLDRIAKYSEALPLYEQSLHIKQEIGDRAGEGATLNNISGIHKARGDYDTALTYLEQSLAIRQEIGDRADEGTTLNNIGEIYRMQGDYATALKYLEQSLSISQEVGDRAGEAVMSWNIGLAYNNQGDLKQEEAYISRAVQLAEELGHPKLEEFREGLEQVRATLRGQ